MYLFNHIVFMALVYFKPLKVVLNIVSAGYPGMGSVNSEIWDQKLHAFVQGNPVLGVQVYLYSEDVSEVFCPQGSGTSSPRSKPALCHAVSDAEGKFVFSGIPCGKELYSTN
jgi:hypothetical protein